MGNSTEPSSIPQHVFDRIERIHARNAEKEAAKKAAGATRRLVENKPEETRSPDRFLLNQEPSPVVQIIAGVPVPTSKAVRSPQEQPDGEELVDDPKYPGTRITKSELLQRDGPSD